MQYCKHWSMKCEATWIAKLFLHVNKTQRRQHNATVSDITLLSMLLGKHNYRTTERRWCLKIVSEWLALDHCSVTVSDEARTPQRALHALRSPLDNLVLVAYHRIHWWDGSWGAWRLWSTSHRCLSTLPASRVVFQWPFETSASIVLEWWEILTDLAILQQFTENDIFKLMHAVTQC